MIELLWHTSQGIRVWAKICICISGYKNQVMYFCTENLPFNNEKRPLPSGIYYICQRLHPVVVCLWVGIGFFQQYYFIVDLEFHCLRTLSKENTFTGWGTYLWFWMTSSDSKTICVTVLDTGILKPNGMFIAHICISMPSASFGMLPLSNNAVVWDLLGKRKPIKVGAHFSMLSILSWCFGKLCNGVTEFHSPSFYYVVNEATEPARNPDRPTHKATL